MKVLVTGGAGFIGSHTVDKLVEQGFEVIVVDNLSTGKAENLNPRCTFIEMDVADRELTGIFDKLRPDYVIHLAAQISVPRSVEYPIEDCRTNVFGGVNLFDNCRRFGVKKVVYASSAAVYGNPKNTVVSENDDIDPLSFYGVSKLTAEYYLEVFSRLYGLSYTVLRYANVFGPRQDALGEGGVVSIFALNVLKGKSPVIYGTGEQTRDFIYVEDVASANIKALFEADGMSLNIGTGLRTSVNMLFDTMARIVNKTDLRPEYTKPREGDILHSCMNIEKALSSLDWKPVFTLEKGLEKTLKYYEKFFRGCGN